MRYRLLLLLSLFTFLPLTGLSENISDHVAGDTASSEIQEGRKEGRKEGRNILSPFSISIELASKYVWRGLEYGTSPVPFGTLAYSTHGFSVWGMGAYAFNGSHAELDFGLSYTHQYFAIGVADYYYPTEAGSIDRYFQVKNTGHWGEAYVTITPPKVPLWVTGSCYIYGADKNPEGKQAFSSYAEIGYTHTFKDAHDLSLCVGAALNNGFYTDYEKGFSVVNVTLKYATAIPFSEKFALPVSASLIANPSKNKVYFAFSVYLDI